MSKRADARLNRARILAAAADVVAEEGTSVPLDLVCARAAVGRATLYRNFPDRQALMLALLDETLERLEAAAVALGGRDDAVFALLAHVAEEMADSMALFDYLSTADISVETVSASRARLAAVLDAPIERARQAGLIRATVGTPDMLLAFRMFAGVLQDRDAAIRKQTCQRALDIVIHGVAASPKVDGVAVWAENGSFQK
jgi:AcrR family transcriptional regulator